MKTLRTVLARVQDERLDLGRKYLFSNLDIAVSHFERANVETSNGQIPLPELLPTHVRTMMRRLMELGRSPRTINNYRQSILFLWESAEEYDEPGWDVPALRRKRIPKLRETESIPTAWFPEEFEAILDAASKVRTRRGWGNLEWRALILTVYDTSLRITCLLRSQFEQLDVNRRVLRVPGKLQKGRCETAQPLHPDTCHALLNVRRVPGETRLFPYPWHLRDIWRRLESQILVPAGLPCTHRDKFHRIRRTSGTHVFVAHGQKAFQEHLSHKSDLSKLYVDPRFLNRPDPLTALPRPGEHT